MSINHPWINSKFIIMLITVCCWDFGVFHVLQGMTHLMAECSVMVVKEWKSKIDSHGGAADVKVDDCLRRFTRDVISRACFGSNYSKGEEIFFKIRALQEAMSKKVLSNGFPGMRFGSI